LFFILIIILAFTAAAAPSYVALDKFELEIYREYVTGLVKCKNEPLLSRDVFRAALNCTP